MGIEPSRPTANTQVIDFNYSTFGNIWEILKQIGGSCIKMSNLSFSRRLTMADSATVSPEGKNRYHCASCSGSAASTSSIVGNPFTFLFVLRLRPAASRT